MPCYLLRIPIELRFRIYGFLLPDSPIPAQRQPSGALRSDFQRPNIAIMRVNRQIHDEAADLLYGQTPFCIAVSDKGTTICNAFQLNPPNRPTSLTPGLAHVPIPGAHALQDYQMQLMLLEQQNMRRKIMACRQQSAMNNLHVRTMPPQLEMFESIKPQSIHRHVDPGNGYGPIWQHPFNSYFDMIRSFHVEIEHPDGAQNINKIAMQQQHTHPATQRPSGEFLETQLYEACDQLHQLVGRFDQVQPNINHLQISIRIAAYDTREEAVAAAKLLLRPFSRLRSVNSPKIVSVNWNRCELMPHLPAHAFYKAEISLLQSKRLEEFIQRWSSSVTSSGDPPPPSSIMRGYWLLYEMVSDIVCHIGSKSNELVQSLRRARVSREADDLLGLREEYEGILQQWNEHSAKQRSLEENIEYSAALLTSVIYNETELTASQNSRTSGKAKMEDISPRIDQDGTRYSMQDGMVRTQLMTPKLVSSLLCRQAYKLTFGRCSTLELMRSTPTVNQRNMRRITCLHHESKLWN